MESDLSVLINTLDHLLVKNKEIDKFTLSKICKTLVSKNMLEAPDVGHLSSLVPRAHFLRKYVYPPSLKITMFHRFGNVNFVTRCIGTKGMTNKDTIEKKVTFQNQLLKSVGSQLIHYIVLFKTFNGAYTKQYQLIDLQTFQNVVHV